MSRRQNNEMREAVLRLDSEGLRLSEIAVRLGVSASLVSYYLGNRERRSPAPLPTEGNAALPETLVTLSEDAAAPEAPVTPGGGAPGDSPRDVLAETLAAVLGERDAAASASDRLRAAELLLRHAGGLKSEAAWSPPREVWTAFLEEAARAHGWGPREDGPRTHS